MSAWDVLEIWHEYRERYIGTENGELPPMEELEAAARHTDINSLVIDREAGTVYLTDPEASLDLGAVAKGYATEQIARKLYADGFTSFAMSSGGNVRVMDAPADGSKTAGSSASRTRPLDGVRGLCGLGDRQQHLGSDQR